MAIPSAIPKLLNFNQEHLSKNWFFRSSPYKIEVMITSPTEMLESVVGDVMTRNYGLITFISKQLYFKKA